MSRPSCPVTGKAAFRDRIAAEMSLAKIRRRDDSRRAKVPCRAYRCQMCGAWHLTSQTQRRPS